MHPYLPHLLSDIESVIKILPPAPYYEVPPHLAEMPEVAEMEESPITTLEELTGIAIDSIPNFYDLTYEEWPLLANAFKRLLEALNITIVDLPDDFPDDAYINLIVCHWHENIQYLPLGGFHLECCTGKEETCPYGEDCIRCGPNALPMPEGFLPPGTGGIFMDDGTPVDPSLVHIPDLCLSCSIYLSEDWEDNILCTLTRMNLQEGEEFECFAYRKGLDEPNTPE